MTNIMDYVKAENFSMGEVLPDGDTFFDLTKTEVSTFESEWDGKKRTRYILNQGKPYFVGSRVMDGIKNAVAKNFTKVRVTKTGEGKNTVYTVIGIKE